MKVVLVSPYIELTSMGVRCLSSYLRKNGHSTRLVFLPDIRSIITSRSDFTASYPEGVDEQLIELCRDADLVGFSLMTNYFYKVAELSKAIREGLSIPVVWGGAHPTVSPEECLDYADYVCVGEGEGTLLELANRLANGERPTDVPNTWSRSAGEVVRNPLNPLIEDLDTLPIPDYSLDGHYVLVGDTIKPLTESLMKKYWTACSYFEQEDDIIYETQYTRGCPYHCSFCINDYLLKLYNGESYFRRRSVDHLMSELSYIKERFPWFTHVIFTDDCFTAAKPEELREFSQRYRAEIDKPFFTLFTYSYMVRPRVEPLLDAGLIMVEMGLQTASPRMNELYRRDYFSSEKFIERTLEFAEISGGRARINYDIILDNPYETVGDHLKTLRLAAKLPEPKWLHLFSFTFYPGIELYRKALEDGTIDDPRVHYLKDNENREARYVNILFSLLNRKIPMWLFRILSFPPLVYLMESPPFRFLFNRLQPIVWKRIRRARLAWAEENFTRIFENMKEADELP